MSSNLSIIPEILPIIQQPQTGVSSRKRRVPLAVNNLRRRNFVSLDLSQVPEASSPIGPSSPGGESILSTDSQPFASTSDDDSQSLDAAPKKRLRISTPSVCSTYSVAFDDPDVLCGSTTSLSFVSTNSSTVSRVHHEHGRFLDEHNIYEFIGDLVIDRGSVDHSTFNARRLNGCEYKRFMEIARRLASLANRFEPSKYRRIKRKVIPEDTRIVFSTKREPYLLTPFYEESLDTYVKKRDYAMAERDVQPIIKQVLEILEFCHAANMFLCDFKLSKFVFTQNQNLRLCTPMNLKLSDDDGLLNQRAASLKFYAPELLSRNCIYSGVGADMWALGVMTFMLLMQRYPFTGETPQLLIDSIRHRRFCIPWGLHVSLRAKSFVYSLLSVTQCDRGIAKNHLLSAWILANPMDLVPQSARWISRPLYRREPFCPVLPSPRDIRGRNNMLNAAVAL